MVERQIVNPWSYQDRAGFVHANDLRDVSRFVVCSGQASVDDDGRPVHAGDMLAQIHRTLDNIETVLAGVGLSLDNVVRLNYFTTDMEAFGAAFRGFRDRLTESECRPASTLLGVTQLGMPELLVEIEATAAA